MALDRAVRMALEGSLQDSKTVVALLLARERLASGGDQAGGSPP